MTGERLGTIGQVEGERAKQANLPQWKKEFLEKPSISVRKGIAWVSRVNFEFILVGTSIIARDLCERHQL